MSEMSSCPKIDLIYKSLGIIVGVCGGVVSFLNFVVKLIEYNAASKQLGRYSYNAISTCKYDLIFAVFIFFLFCIVLILFVLFKKITFWWNFVLSIVSLSGSCCFSILLCELLEIVYANFVDNQNLNIAREYGLGFCFVIIPLIFFFFVAYYHFNQCILFFREYKK